MSEPMPEIAPARRAATVGTFDGVHTGHRLLLRTLADKAADRDLEPTVFTFDRHPLSVVAPDRAPGMLLSREWRDRLLRGLSFETVEIPFNEAVRKLPAAQFMRLLCDRYGVRLLVVGYDNRFGCDARHSDISDYISIGRSLGIDVIEAPELPGVSSSAVRHAVRDGDMPLTESLLGYGYCLSGEVIPGRQLGRQLGFPTANISVPQWKLLPAAGVYACEAKTADSRLFPAMVNIGSRPTVDSPGAPLSVEAHLIDFQGDLYGTTLQLRFVLRLREERRFADLGELRHALEADRNAALAAAPLRPRLPFIF